MKSGFSSSNKNVLSGVKLIDWLAQNEIGHNREQAVAFAQDLFGIKILRHSECNLFTVFISLCKVVCALKYMYCIL